MRTRNNFMAQEQERLAPSVPLHIDWLCDSAAFSLARKESDQ
jgi:hypothetical protein